jgi:hypothetical protein
LNPSDKKWEAVNSIIEDAEPDSIVGRLILTRWREHCLQTSGERSRLTVMVRIVKMHKSPILKAKLVIEERYAAEAAIER